MLFLRTVTSMSIFSTHLGMNIAKNPLIDSPFVAQNQIGMAYPPIDSDFMITEDGIPIITEDNHLMITE